MRAPVILFIAIAVFCAAVQAPAASPKSSAYRRATVEMGYPWKEGVRVRLEADQAACKKHYGKNWEDACAARFADFDAPVVGVKMRPAASGQWRWQGSGMIFVPEAPLSPGTRYTVDLRSVSFPAGVVIAPAVVHFDTLPLAVSFADRHMWIDPSPKAAHGVSCVLTFTYPVNPADMARNISLRPADPTSGVRLGTPRLAWNQAYDQVTVSAPVTALPSAASAVEIRVAGMPAYVVREGRPQLVPAGRDAGAAVSRFNVTGTSRLLSVNAVALSVGHDADLGQEYHLSLETSLHVRPEDVLKSLRLVQLPRVLNTEAESPYDWGRAPAVPADALNKGKTLHAEPLQPRGEAAGKILFRVRPEEGSYIFAYLSPDFAAPTGLKLGRPWQGVLHAAPLEAELEFLQPGNVLALGGDRKLDLRATGLTSIRWEVLQVRSPFLALLAGGDFPSFSRPLEDSRLTFEPLSEATRGELHLTRTTPGASQFTALDLDPLLRTPESGKHDRRGLMQVRLEGLDGDKVVTEARRFVLVTDLGLVVKRAATGAREAFVCSLSEGAPVTGAWVRILGANGLAVAEARTDAQGRASLPSVSGLEREKKPVAVVASRENAGGVDVAWLPLEDTTRRVNYDAFPTGGRTSAADGINAYVFGQRGMFRPGETLYFGCLVRRTDWTALPEDLPLQAVLVNPAGNVVMQRAFTVGADGLASFDWASDVGASTGPYRLDVQLAGAGTGGKDAVVLGTATVLMEEFQPDTLGLEAEIVPAPKAGWLSLDDGGTEAAVGVLLKNLYGLPAADRRIRATLRVNPARWHFPGFEEYTFYDAAPYWGETLEETLPEVRTDKDGTARLSLPLTRFQAGTMRCTVLLEGFEPGGGRAVSEERSVLVSPLDMLLGWRGTGAALNPGFIPQGREAGLEFVALNPALERVAAGPLTFVVSERRYVTSLVTDARGEYRYDESPVDTECSRETLAWDARRGVRWNIPTDRPGDYLLTVRNARDMVLASVPFTVAGEALRGGEAPASSVLRLRLDKADYAAGDTISMFLSVPYDGAGLITLERDGVAAHRWFRAKAGDSVQSIDIPSDFEGRGYVNVSFVRALASPDIYMEPHSYAVAPFTAAVRSRDMGLTLRVPELGRPGDTLSVMVTAREPGKAILFAVVEGVLQLTHFATPSPLEYLLRDRALAVETLQAFDLLMPDHARLKGRIPGFGGGAMPHGGFGGRFLNPFKRRGEPPLTTWSSLVEIGPQGATAAIPIPDYYNGRIRIMAVGASPQSAGNAETAVTVRGEVILTPQVPLLATPGDTFEASVAVANNIQGSGKAKALYLDIEPDAALELAGDVPARVTVDEGGEAVVAFRVRVKDVPGEAAIRFRVRSGEDRALPGVTASRRASLSVRPATPRRVGQTSGSTRASMDIPTSRAMYPFQARASASVSGLPLPAVRGLAGYLDAYPYGCVEQLVSRAFPYAVLYNRPDLLVDARRDPATLRKEVDRVVEAAVQAVGAGLRRDQGVGAWPGNDPDAMLTVYCGDFLLQLREAGRGVPGGLEDAVFDAIERLAAMTPSSAADARIKAYGIWVLTREGRITTQAVEQLLSWLNDAVPGWERDVTASLLAGSCAIMRMDDQARRLLDGYVFDAATFEADGLFSSLAAQALHTAVLARNFPHRLGSDAADTMIGAVLSALGEERYSTFSAAQSIRALMAVSGAAAPVPDKVRLRCVAGTADTNAVATPSAGGALLTLEAPECMVWRLDVPEGGTSPWYWQVTTDGFDRTPPPAAAHGMEVTRTYLDAGGKTVADVGQGEEITVSITARVHGARTIDGVIVDLLPGGFEMVLPRPDERGSAAISQELMRAERREDRMILFPKLSNSVFTYTYRIRAVNKGRFVVPPVQAEAMYEPAVRAHSAAGVVEVK